MMIKTTTLFSYAEYSNEYANILKLFIILAVNVLFRKKKSKITFITDVVWRNFELHGFFYCLKRYLKRGTQNLSVTDQKASKSFNYL